MINTIYVKPADFELAQKMIAAANGRHILTRGELQYYHSVVKQGAVISSPPFISKNLATKAIGPDGKPIRNSFDLSVLVADPSIPARKARTKKEVTIPATQVAPPAVSLDSVIAATEYLPTVIAAESIEQSSEQSLEPEPAVELEPEPAVELVAEPVAEPIAEPVIDAAPAEEPEPVKVNRKNKKKK